MTTMETGSQHWQDDEVDWACWVDTAAGAGADDDDHCHARIKEGTSRIKEGTSRKRLYEHGEGELDREMDKMYKRDYWEDPAKASLLERAGLLVARTEAVLCFSDRVLRASDAMLAQRRQERERRSKAAHEPEPEQARAAAATTAGERRFFFCLWRSVADNLAALLRYFLG